MIKKIFLSLALIMALVLPSAPRAQSVITTSAQLGLSLGVSLTPGQWLTVTASTSNYTRMALAVEIYVTATAAVSSFCIGVLPYSVSSTSLMSSLANETVTAVATGINSSWTPTFGVHGFNEFLMTMLPNGLGSNPVDNFAGYFWSNGSNAALAGGVVTQNPSSLAFPYYRFYIINRDTNTAGLIFYVSNVTLYARTN